MPNLLLTNHSKDIGMIDCAFLLRFFNIRTVQDATDREAKVGTKGMHEHRTADVNHLRIEIWF